MTRGVWLMDVIWQSVCDEASETVEMTLNCSVLVLVLGFVPFMLRSRACLTINTLGQAQLLLQRDHYGHHAYVLIQGRLGVIDHLEDAANQSLWRSHDNGSSGGPRCTTNLVHTFRQRRSLWECDVRN